MPSPIGHMLAGAAAGWLVAGRGRSSALPLLAFAAVGAAPDLDLVIPFTVHRGPTHSLAAAVAAGVVTWLVVRKPGGPVSGKPGSPMARTAGGLERGSRLRFAFAMAVAYATHTLTDWLSADTTPPMGLMALWPLTSEYYAAPAHIFLAVSRRYWLADTWLLNLRAVIREVLILGPLLWIAWWVSRGRGMGEARIPR